MGLSAKYNASHVMPQASKGPVEIEFFGDYNCPYACKLFKRLQDEIVPEMEARGTINKFTIKFVNVVQPWHGGQSSVLHECALAVARLDPSKFWVASRALYDNIEVFYDSNVYDLSKRQLVDRVATLLCQVTGVSKEAIVELVQTGDPKPDGSPNNVGSKVAVDLKYLTRYGRTIGVHVTPSVVINGIHFPSIESSTPLESVLGVFEAQAL